MNKKMRLISFLWFLLMIFMPVSVLAKTYKGTINIKVGETYYVSHGYESNGYTVSGYWTKTDGSAFIITASSSGSGGCEIKGNRVGTSTLNWTGVVSGGWSVWDVEYYWTVNVTEDPIIKVSSITLNTSTLSLKVRQEETLIATIRPSDATDKSVTWSIDNPNVASVGPSGTVKAKAEGNATITCKANDGSGVSATCTLKVEGELPEPETMSIKQVAAGDSHTMILMSDGTLWACGKNENGQLGDGTTTNCNKPKQVMTEVAYVSAGSNHTMIVKEDGSLWACGWNEYGQLGNGTYIDCETPEQIMTGVATVSAGAWHTLILKTDGSLWGCGSNSNGQLGDGTKTGRSTPKKITTGVVNMSAGYTHTMIVKNDGSLWTCGSDESGSLAGGPIFTGSSQWLLSPKQAMTGVKYVAAGNGYSMIIKQDNSLWTCGSNSNGCLGVGSRNIYCNTEQIMTNVKDVSAKYIHTLILKADGSLWTCGWNYRGQIGDGTTTDCNTPKKILTDVSVVSAGFMHSVAVKKDGSLWAWGRNDSGQLGDGTTTDRYTPVEIVFDIKVTDITLNKTSLTLQPEQSESLTATVNPNNATDKRVTWSSENTSVATVDGNGKITAVSAGSTTITCTANDGSGVKAMCNIEVVKPITIEPAYYFTGSINGWNNSDTSYKLTNDGRPVEENPIYTCRIPADGDSNVEFKMTPESGLGGDWNGCISATIDNEEGKFAYNNEGGNLIIYGVADAKYYILTFNMIKQTWSYTYEKGVKGDVNGDSSVNGTDLVALTNIILGKSGKTAAADVNGDGQVNGTDYVALVNIVLGRSNARGMSNTMTQSVGTTGLTIESFDIKAGETKEMVIDLTNPQDEITLVQFDLSLPQGLSIKKVDGDYDIDLARTTWKKHSLDANAQADGTIRFLLASSSNAVLSGTEGAIIKMTLVADNSFNRGDIRLENILMVSPDEKETRQDTYIYSFVKKGTLESPFNALEAKAKASELAVGETTTDRYYVKGVISRIKYFYSEKYGTAVFDISDDGNTDNEFYCYGAYYLENKPWVDGNPQIAVGDEVILYGKLANYKGTLEMADKENYIYSHNGILSLNSDLLYVEPFTISNGETKEMVIDLTNPNDEITLVQFDLHLPNGLSVAKEDGEYAIDIAGRTTWKKHSLDANAIDDGIVRFLLSSTKNAVLEGTSGAIINIKLQADNSYNNGTIRLENILLVTPDEKEIKPADVDTGIVGITTDSAKNAPIYSLSGQRLAVPRKGINIVGGKKVIVK